MLPATIDAPETFAGSLVQPLHWVTGVREYHSQDAAGQVFLHGVTNADRSYVVFDPPILRMVSAFAPGVEWETTTELIYYSIDGVELGRQAGHSTSRVISVGSVDVPAGTFQAAEVQRTEQTGSLTQAFRDMYAEGVGWIRRTDETGASILFQLETYGPGPTPTRVMSWGAVKSQYKE